MVEFDVFLQQDATGAALLALSRVSTGPISEDCLACKRKGMLYECLQKVPIPQISLMSWHLAIQTSTVQRLIRPDRAVLGPCNLLGGLDCSRRILHGT